VIAPIEKMVKFVEYISKDPLGQNENFTSVSLENTEGMETILLLQTISKIASLMKVGFGEAGASTIAAVLKESNSDAINLVGPGNGKKIKSIFGFCDVRNFTDTTECLQEEVMLFVNRIAHILHSIVVQCSGSANKNIGDAFLLTWKVDEKAKPGKTAALADQALLTFCLALIELSRHEDFIVDFSAQSMHRLNRRNLTKVRIGCGLHFGWAIEGAIGSAKKIDASYLSPHVGMAEFLESSTKAYGVPLLLSEPFYKLLSLSASKWIRQVDRIQRSEAEGPFGIYTYDADPEIDWAARDIIPRLVVKGPGQGKGGASPMRGEHVMMKLRRSSTNKIDTAAFDKVPEDVTSNAPTIKLDPYTPSIWERNRDLIALRHKIKDPFRIIWKEGIEAYIKGDWEKAMAVFHKTYEASLGQDGPTKFLMNFIESQGGKAPADWKGFRQD
jgi:class 3 adenylate cyclase